MISHWNMCDTYSLLSLILISIFFVLIIICLEHPSSIKIILRATGSLNIELIVISSYTRSHHEILPASIYPLSYDLPQHVDVCFEVFDIRKVNNKHR